MKEVKSILEFDNGSIIEKVQYELNGLMANIRDINTDEKERVLTIKIKLKPDEKRKFVSMVTEVNKTTRPTKPTATLMQLSMTENGLAATEVTDEIDGQMSLDGNVKETKIIQFPNKNIG